MKTEVSGRMGKSRKARARIVQAPPSTRVARPRTIKLSAMASPDEIRTTTDFLEIRSWAEKRGGYPAIVKGGVSEEETGLWIEFPGTIEARDLERISWEEWYQKLLDKDLCFVYQERTSDGKESCFFRVAGNS